MAPGRALISTQSRSDRFRCGRGCSRGTERRSSSAAARWTFCACSVSRAGEVVPKNEILSYAWSGLAVEEISLRVHVAELRKVLGDGKDGARYITNVPSRGYCFVAPVQRGERNAAPALAPRAPERTAPPAALPHRLDRMIGRDDVLPELSARLLSDRFVTLRGPGGIGKTTVAIALAHDMWQAFEGTFISSNSAR